MTWWTLSAAGFPGHTPHPATTPSPVRGRTRITSPTQPHHHRLHNCHYHSSNPTRPTTPSQPLTTPAVVAAAAATAVTVTLCSASHPMRMTGTLTCFRWPPGMAGTQLRWFRWEKTIQWTWNKNRTIKAMKMDNVVVSVLFIALGDCVCVFLLLILFLIFVNYVESRSLSFPPSTFHGCQ